MTPFRSPKERRGFYGKRARAKGTPKVMESAADKEARQRKADERAAMETHLRRIATMSKSRLRREIQELAYHVRQGPISIRADLELARRALAATREELRRRGGAP